MKKKWMKIAALIVALLIIAGLCVFANALVGNPVSKWLATRTAEKHLEEVYGDTDFVIEKIGFNFRIRIITPTLYPRAAKTAAFHCGLECGDSCFWTPMKAGC